MFSGTTSYSMTRDEVIVDALGKIRAIDLESAAAIVTGKHRHLLITKELDQAVSTDRSR